jgi:histidinol-phosphatase
MSRDLEFALDLADAADEISMRWFGSRNLQVDTKPDLTPVTAADHEVEELLRGRARKGEGFLGEEAGETKVKAGAKGRGKPARWIVDPIDGTRNFARGIPVFATLIALERAGKLVLGVVSAPALHRRWWAERGGGAWMNGEPINVSGVRRIEDAVVAYTSARDFFAKGVGDQFVDLANRSWSARGVGDFWMHMLVAEGAAELAIDLTVSLWDVAAVLPIVEEAGGRFTDLSGAARADGGSGVSSNGAFHDEALALFGPKPS